MRLRVTGSRGSHAVEGVLSRLTHNGALVEVETNGRTILFPAGNIESILLQQSGDWIPVPIPKRLEDVIEPLSRLFLDGTGQLRKQLSESALTNLIDASAAAESELVDKDLRSSAGHLTQALLFLRRSRDAHNYESADAERRGAVAAIAAGRAAIPSTYSHDLAPLTDAFDGTEEVLNVFWRNFIAELDPRPRFISSSKPAKVSVERGNEISLPLRIKLENDTAPASAVSVLIAPGDDVDYLASPPSFEVLTPGSIETFRHPAVLNARESRKTESRQIRVRAQLRYKTPSGDMRTSPMQTLVYEVVPKAPFKKIHNPYSPYAGGTTVADPRMFFGRASLLDRILSEMRDGPAGQGLALYGQKRSGKSSLVEQIRARAHRKPVIVISLSLGILDRENLTASFARAVLDKARVSLLGELDGSSYAHVSRLWPSDERIENRPLESLTGALDAGRATLSRQQGWQGLRYILLVDEFTYLFELLRSRNEADRALHGDVREFLRQWKALLESRAFSAVVVGQDTMPYFMQLFPNEFSMMRPIRLSYLSEDETKELADRPIQKPDRTTRYSGFALENVYQYTAGHPYFTQVLCDRIVDLANERARAEITELDVDEAADSLMSGSDRLDPYRFDCLLTADNSGLISVNDGSNGYVETEDPGAGAAYEVLESIARLSGSSELRVPRGQLATSQRVGAIVSDLIVRDVLDDNGGLKIKVHLFSEYLRRTAQ